MVAYSPKANAPIKSLKYTQGVGTVTEKNESHEVFMYPTFAFAGGAELPEGDLSR